MVNYANIRDASMTAVVDQFRQIKASGNLSAGLFISSNNPYRVVQAPEGSDTARNIAEYIASSCLTHLYDGWNYMSAALRAFVHNDVGVCGHSAYYAELRAALAFLAANGIIICWDDGSYLKSDSSVGQLYRNSRTHKAAWDALKAFAQLPSNTPDKIQIEKLIEVGGYKLADWIAELSGARSSRTLFKSFLLDCGADLELYADDKDRRSKYSYSPTALENYKKFPEQDIREIVNRFWDLFEPESPGRFEKIDLYILQSICDKLKDSMGWNEFEYKKHIINAIHKLAFGDTQKFLLKKLCGQKIELPFDLNGDGAANADLHGSMVVRACFMLRLATAACRNLLTLANVTSQDLNVWLTQCQKLRFMWQAAVPNYKYDELWADVNMAMESLDTYTPRGTEPWIITEAESLETLSKTEYIMLWGLGL